MILNKSHKIILFKRLTLIFLLVFLSNCHQCPPCNQYPVYVPTQKIQPQIYYPDFDNSYSLYSPPSNHYYQFDPYGPYQDLDNYYNYQPNNPNKLNNSNDYPVGR